MKLYTVKVPIVAVCYIEVEAETEEEAVGKAFESDDLKLENVEEWEPLEHITQGNVIYTYHNDAEVVSEIEIEESEEED